MTQAEGAMAADFALMEHEATDGEEEDEDADDDHLEIVKVGSERCVVLRPGQCQRGGSRPSQDSLSDSGCELSFGEGAVLAGEPQERGPGVVVRPGPDPWPTARRKLRAAVRAVALAPRFNLDPAVRRSYELDQAVDAKAVAQIDLDVPRTAGGRAPLQACVGRIRSLLLRSLAEDPELGYCQGLNLVAAVFAVASVDHDEAYARLSKLLQRTRGLWLPGLPLLDSGIQVFEACVQDRAWFHHLSDYGIESTMYLPQALMTTMAMWLPLDMLVKCIYVAEEDGLAGLLAMAIALLDLCGERLLGTPCMEGLLQVLKALQGFVPPVDVFLGEVQKVRSFTVMCLRIHQALDREPVQVPFSRRGSRLLTRDGHEAFEPCMTASPWTPTGPTVSEFSPDFGMSIPAIVGSVEDSAPDSSWFSALFGATGAADAAPPEPAEATGQVRPAQPRL